MFVLIPIGGRYGLIPTKVTIGIDRYGKEAVYLPKYGNCQVHTINTVKHLMFGNKLYRIFDDVDQMFLEN